MLFLSYRDNPREQGTHCDVQDCGADQPSRAIPKGAREYLKEQGAGQQSQSGGND
jgi:hypothetical protein